MIENNRERLYLLMAMLAEEYTPGKLVSDLKGELWFEELKQYTIEKIEQSIKKIIRTRTLSTYPKVSEIIREIEGSSEDKSLTAWLKVKESIARVGAYQSVQFDDPVIHSVINDLGGWPKVCEVLEDDLKWMQKDFERIYQLCSKQQNHPQKAIGISETDNGGHGIDFKQEPVQIGNVNKIKQLEVNNEL